MLPKTLSNGICSLNEEEDRRTLSCFVTLDKKGKIISCDIKKSLIKSKVRGVYSEVNDILDKGEGSEYYDKYSCLFPDTLPTALELYKILAKKSSLRGAMELETTESIIHLDETGYPDSITKRERGISERLIEQFMLCANEAVANWLFDMSMPCVYRIHEKPDAEKIHSFALFAHNSGLDAGVLAAKNIHPSMLSRILRQAKEKGIGATVSNVLLRCLSKAKYSPEASLHFGLCIDKYCHFTSPIRRYPDLATHRIISNILSGNISEVSANYLYSFAARAAEKSSENEIRAMNAERDIENMYKCLYLYQYIGKEFEAIVCSVTSFGFFAELENTCEGLVPIGSLEGEYIFDEGSYSLLCGSKRITLGQRVRVTVEDVNVTERKITFSACDF